MYLIAHIFRLYFIGRYVVCNPILTLRSQQTLLLIPDASSGKWKGAGQAVFALGKSLKTQNLLDDLCCILIALQEYQQGLFSELRIEDELVLLARGLGLLRVIINLLHSYDAAGNNLIVVVGADDRENSWIGEGLGTSKDLMIREGLKIHSAGGACRCE